MDDKNFDRIVRALAAAGDRRQAIKGVGAGALAGLLGLRATDALGKTKAKGGKGKGSGKDKVAICHKPGKPAQKTLYVPEQAVDGHLGHGDYLGECKDGDECKGDGDCGACESCDEGTCKSDCKTGETCENDVCVPDGCEGDGDCATCQVCDLEDGICKPLECTANSTCLNGECACDDGYVPGPDDTCVPAGTDQCPGKCFFIEDRNACFSCPAGSKATARGTCRCQFKARTCKREFGGQAVRPVRCTNS